jgi:CO/xanthine dehydrogenase Mo-binding subunit
VLTGIDAATEGLQPIPDRPEPTNPYEVPLRSRDGSPFFIAPHPVLAIEKVRYVGEPVAVVIAETLSMDAAGYLAVMNDPLPAVARSANALAPGAPVVWEEHGANFVRRLGSRRGDRRRLRACRIHRAVDDGDQPGHRRADGIAGGCRRL